jgi:dipeptidyl aminopeptidase/acylaminoacyl peptidase
LTDGGSEFMYLKRSDIQSGRQERVDEADWDILYAYFSFNGKYRVVGINKDGRTEIKICENESGDEVDLPEFPRADITSVTLANSEKRMAFYVSGSRSPNTLCVYDFDKEKYWKLVETMSPEVKPDDWVDGRVVRFESFDGLKIPAILYRPYEAGRGASAPAVVAVHGGPGGQARLGYSALIQYLVNHGYVVLDVNYRGSSGYGKTFSKLDDLKHGEDDLASSTRRESVSWAAVTAEPWCSRHSPSSRRRSPQVWTCSASRTGSDCWRACLPSGRPLGKRSSRRWETRKLRATD